MQAPAVTVRRTTGSDWEALRGLRLEMLRDTPIAFGETLEAALAHGEPEWRMRAARGDSAGTVNLAAIADGRWVGTMGAYVPNSSTGAMLVGVYVSPEFRGAGVADALLAEVEAWAAQRGPALTLHVHETNLRARAYYARRGFAKTGAVHRYVLDPTAREIEMRKTL
jgi:GNAT superfamily N-acetyltransferase